MALAGKNRGIRFVMRPKTYRYIGFDGKHDYLKLTIVNQMSANSAEIGKSSIKMPIAHTHS
jgi:hypothetical protein